MSPERALEVAGKIQYHNVTLTGGKKTQGLSRLDAQQLDLFASVNIPQTIENEVIDML